MHNHHNNIKSYGEKIQEQSVPEVLSKQEFHCNCSKIFTTLDDYQYHIDNETHHLEHINSTPYDPIPLESFNGLQNNHEYIEIEKSYQNNLFNEIQNDNNFPKINNSNIFNYGVPQNSTYFDKKSYENHNFLNRYPINELYQEDFTRESQIEHKAESFKYIQAYYATKLAPYYREFDIDPEKPFHNKKYHHENKYHSSKNSKVLGNELRFTRSEATRDLNKVLEELEVRMIPVENNLIEFIYNFSRENFEKIIQVKQEDVEKINNKLEENINELMIICYNNKKNVENDKLFMDTDIDFIIKMFVQFLKEILRQNELLIAYLMLIPLIEGIIKFQKTNEEFLYENLKLVDFPIMLNSIKIEEFLLEENFPLKIEGDKITQFLIWFTQWYTMLQLVKSKWNIDFMEPSLNQIHYINSFYKENVNKYRNCVIKKQVEQVKKYKKKMIEKEKIKKLHEMQRQQQIKKIKKFKNKFNYPIIQNAGDFNIEGKMENYPKPEYKLSGEKEPFNRLTYADSENAKINQNEKERVFTTASEVNHIFHNRFNEKNASEYKIKKNYKHLLENRFLNSQINSGDPSEREDDFEDDEMKEAFISAFRSHYVSYFSPESVEVRKEEEKKWKIKNEKLNEIIKNPELLKPEIFSEVSQQLEEVNQLIGQVRIDFRLHNSYQQEIMRRTANKPHKEKIKNQNINIFESNQVNDFINGSKSLHGQKDPFIVEKNYRFRNYASSYFSKSEFLAKYLAESEEFESKNQQENSSKLEIQEKKDELISEEQSERFEEKQKSRRNEKKGQKEIDKIDDEQIKYEEEESNDFLDEHV